MIVKITATKTIGYYIVKAAAFLYPTFKMKMSEKTYSWLMSIEKLKIKSVTITE